uniref:ATP synthase subunit a n=1 Tax=Helorus sp. ZJUH_2016017 TaxID=2491159 RepID=A0A3S8V0S1_9HYME|nr:ATP synthase F0 subunit 6 [Helorus sp. ZJUH_2016017]
MMNLFSIFDPSTSMKFSFNWISMILFLMFTPKSFWLLKSRNNIYLLILMKLIKKEIKIILKPQMHNSIMLLSLMTLILFSNLTTLFPYIFPFFSHLSISLSLSLTLWVSLMMFGMLTNYKKMLAHLTPMSTPVILMPFMVLIETISSLIRPLTLAIRLTANIIAGHLLMTLLSNSVINLMNLFFLTFPIEMILMILEISVSMIQSYVFMILLTIYIKEI